MSEEGFLNSYRNASTPPPSELRPDLAAFILAADPILSDAGEIARVLVRAHQAAATQLIGGGWRTLGSSSRSRRSMRSGPTTARRRRGSGSTRTAHTVDRPIRLTDQELRAHPEWRDFGPEAARHPPMRGWLVAPLIGSDGKNYGFIQASDRLEGDFTEQDEANLVRLASLTSAALDAPAQLHLPDYREKIGLTPSAGTEVPT
jgi:GAF domain-containing protein